MKSKNFQAMSLGKFVLRIQGKFIFRDVRPRLYRFLIWAHAMNDRQFGLALVLFAAWLLAGCDVGASNHVSSTTFTGSISIGIPLADSTVVVTDSGTPARTFTAQVLADGSYSVNTAGGIAPFLFHAQGHAGSGIVELFSASAASSGKVDISPQSSLVVADAAGQDCAAAPCTPSVFTSAKLADSGAKVQAQLVPLLTQFGLAIADTLDSQQGASVRTRKWVFFKHVAVGGYVYSRDGPLEFVKDTATGNWQLAGIPKNRAGTKTADRSDTYVPPPGASSFGTWLPFLKDSSVYPDGATLIVVSSSGITPPVTLVYENADKGTEKITGPAMVRAVAGVSFLPACPRPSGQSGSCVNVAQTGNYLYSARIDKRGATIHGQVRMAHPQLKRSISLTSATSLTPSRRSL